MLLTLARLQSQACTRRSDKSEVHDDEDDDDDDDFVIMMISLIMFWPK